jgi:nucleoside phosphorylase
MAHQLRHDDYTVGWVCALPIELAAAQEMLDEKHPYLKLDPADDDKNLYAFGSIGEYNIVIMCLPTGQIGNNPAAAVATQMRATFENIKFGLLVGIGGGVPSDEADVRLGDVVVSQPRRVVAGVMQYDVGTATPSGFERIGAVNSPPQILLAAVTRVRVNKLRGRSKLSDYVSNLERRIATFQRVKAGPDILFEGTYDHSGGKTCDQCSVDRQVARHLRESKDEVVVHYGTIASGNQVMRNAAERDRVSAELGGVLCFEMEAAGLMNSFPCLVVRGICDYSDSHRNKLWRPYAAATAAAYAKELLSTIPSVDIAKSRTVQGVMWSAYSQYNDDSSMDLVHGHDTTDRDSQPSSPWYSFLQEALTAPTMASHTHGFSNKIWSSTGKVSEVITDATSHTTQDSAFEPPNQSRETAPSKLTMARPVNRPYETSRRATFKTATFKTATFETITRWDKGRIDKLAKQLFGVVNCPGVAQAALDRVSESLPDLLRAFAVKVDYQFQSHMHLDVMFYVQKLRV